MNFCFILIHMPFMPMNNFGSKISFKKMKFLCKKKRNVKVYAVNHNHKFVFLFLSLHDFKLILFANAICRYYPIFIVNGEKSWSTYVRILLIYHFCTCGPIRWRYDIIFVEAINDMKRFDNFNIMKLLIIIIMISYCECHIQTLQQQ